MGFLRNLIRTPLAVGSKVGSVGRTCERKLKTPCKVEVLDGIPVFRNVITPEVKGKTYEAEFHHLETGDLVGLQEGDYYLMKKGNILVTQDDKENACFRTIQNENGDYLELSEWRKKDNELDILTSSSDLVITTKAYCAPIDDGSAIYNDPSALEKTNRLKNKNRSKFKIKNI